MPVAPMTFLDLAKRVVSELGTDLPGNLTSVLITPATAYGSTTEYLNKCVNWVKQAWIEIQEDQTDWNFMRTKGIFDLVQGQAQYDISLQDGLSDYDKLIPFVAPVQRRYIWITDGSVSPMNRTQCYYVEPELYFGYYDRLNLVSGLSYRYTFTSNGCILLNPAPGTPSYKAEFRYQRLPQELTEDTDTPTGLPPKYHMVIVYWAMEFYSGFDETQPQWARALKLKKRMMNKMYITETPEYMVAGVR